MIVLGIPFDDPDPVMPHAALTASIRPTPADVFRAAQECGWLPCEPLLRPVVPVRGMEG